MNTVVTGGASGLGFAIAERLIASRANVVIWDLNGEAAHAAGKEPGGLSMALDARAPERSAQPFRTSPEQSPGAVRC